MKTVSTTSLDRHALVGLLSVWGAYACWGFVPLFYRQLMPVHYLEILAHRVIWACVGMALLKVILGNRGVLRFEWRKWKTVRTFLLTAFCIMTNWVIFTWAVVNEHVLETSLGYFINPLVSVLVGVIFLRESLRPAQLAAVLIAAVAVGQMVLRHGEVPWIALCLAGTFATYALVKKHTSLDAINGQLMEMSMGMPIALAYLGYLASQSQMQFVYDGPYLSILLGLSGIVTLVPLVLFGHGAPRLNLSTIGLLQYTTPTLSFLLAVFAFGEPFDEVKALAFVLIWIALTIYTWDSLRARRTPVAQELAEAGSVLD